MAAPHGFQHGVLHGLRVDRHSVNVVRLQHCQFIRRDGVRPAGLHRVLGEPRKVKALLHLGQQPFQLGGGQGGGGAAADVDGADKKPRLPEVCGAGRYLLTQSIQIGLHQLQRLLHVSGDKAAIGAAGGAEGNADVEGDLIRLQAPLHRQPRLSRVQRQLRAGLRDEISVQE